MQCNMIYNRIQSSLGSHAICHSTSEVLETGEAQNDFGRALADLHLTSRPGRVLRALRVQLWQARGSLAPWG